MNALFENDSGLSLLNRIDPRYRPVWEHKSEKDQQALALYFLPHRSAKPVLGPTRPRILKWYCPFACQKVFASGHRYCINVYTGCEHQCVYCYAAGYEPENANPKKSFEKLLCKDMEDLETFDVPPAPVHLSNSTDPFQPMEERFGHTKFALEQILQYRHRFTTVTVLTKNPLRAVQSDYVELFRKLAAAPAGQNGHPGLVVEVSLAFLQETARKVYDPGAPSVLERMQGIRLLRAAGIPVVMRIDPLFPRSPITESKTMVDFGLPEAQTIEDLKTLLAFAKENGVHHIVYSVGKLVPPRYRPLPEVMQKMKKVYETVAAPERLVWQGGSYRLPYPIANEKITAPFLKLCEDHNLAAKFCKQNLINTP
ncbi:MAG: hypothetical protein ISS71_09715 [Phycisphaerae bacterium]|nr:hypothetical protein [Phycisphaerae bacterium]